MVALPMVAISCDQGSCFHGIDLTDIRPDLELIAG